MNKNGIEVSFTEKEYEVLTYQGKFAFYDEQEMTDPMVVDTGLDGIAKKMVNDFTSKAIAEYDKATLTAPAEAWSFDAVVDAIAKKSPDKLAMLHIDKNKVERRFTFKDMKEMSLKELDALWDDAKK